MKTLSELSVEYALSSPERARAAIAYAARFTRVHREAAGLAVAERETALLGVQFPRILQAAEKEDLFVGRVRYELVGLSPEPCGLGYYCCPAVAAWLDEAAIDADLCATARDVVEYWKTRSTAARVRAAYPPDVAASLSSDAWTEDSGTAFPLYRMAGSVLDYATLLEKGLDGLSADLVERAQAAVGAEAHSFYRGTNAALDVLRTSIDHYAEQRLDADLRKTLRAIRHDPPQTLREAIQLFWLYALHAGTWNYGRLDDVLGPFLERDIERGLLTEDSALELLCSLWRLMHAYANQYNNRVIIGGKGRRNEQSADRFALLATEATRRVQLNQPQLSLRFYRGQDKRLWEKALDAIGEGRTFPILYNDDVNIPAVAQAFDVSEVIATHYTPFGCGSYVLGHYSVGSPNRVINLLKALELALHGGVDPQTKIKEIEGLPSADALHTFEDLWKAYTTVVEHYVDALAQQQKSNTTSLRGSSHVCSSAC